MLKWSDRRGLFMFQQVENKKYYMQIVDQIREQIESGRLKTGERLPPERELCQKFGTSRASMREAFSVLETLGMIESRSGQGNFIRADASQVPIDGEFFKSLLKDHDPFEIYETRLEIEPSMAAYAAERVTEEEKQELIKQKDLLNEIGDKLETDRSFFEIYMEEDRRFHLLVGRAAHNKVLFIVFAAVNLMMKEDHWKKVKSKGVLKNGNLQVYKSEHSQICDAICGGRAEEARLYMRKHILDIRKIYSTEARRHYET